MSRPRVLLIVVGPVRGGGLADAGVSVDHKKGGRHAH